MKKPTFIILIVLGFTAILTGLWVLQNRAVSALPDFGEVPDFRLEESRGKPFAKVNLLGKFSLVHFIYTSCGGQCPMIVKKVKSIDQELAEKERYQYVAISVDPATDTPAKLLDYAKKQGIDWDRWSLLTGPREKIQSLIEGGFKLGVGTSSETLNKETDEIFHSAKIVLVDPAGHIRGYYDALEEGPSEQLLKDLVQLVKYGKF